MVTKMIQGVRDL